MNPVNTTNPAPATPLALLRERRARHRLHAELEGPLPPFSDSLTASELKTLPASDIMRIGAARDKRVRKRALRAQRAAS